MVELPRFIPEPELPADVVPIWANMNPGTLLKVTCDMFPYTFDQRRTDLSMLLPVTRGAYDRTITKDSILMYMGTMGLDMLAAGSRIMRRRFVVVLHGPIKYIVNDLNHLIPA